MAKATAFRPILALLPINGNDPSLGVAGDLNGEEAAKLAQAVGARIAIPQPYDMFEFNTASPEIVERRCRELDVRFRQLAVGERLELKGIAAF